MFFSLFQIMKPKLPRKLATSARINLNKYWHALEELMPVSCRALDESDSNAINENLDNERRLAAMRLSELQEIGNCGSSDSSGVCTIPSLNTTLGKKTSHLKLSTTSSNVLLDSQSSSSALSSSLMNIDCSPSSSTCDVDSTPMTESPCLFTSFSNREYSDENTPPLNGPSITGGNASR